MPYIIQNRDHIRRVSQEMLDDTFQPAAERNGYKILAFWENGFRNITNNVRPINKPGDLEGIKLRTPKGEWRVKMFKSYGANPTPMAFSDVFTALKTGVIDGQENPYAQIASAKFQEVQEYLSITGHVYTPGYILTGKNKFESLPEDVQAALKEAALETQEYVYETASRLETELLAELEERYRSQRGRQAGFHRRIAADLRRVRSTVEGGDELVDQVMSLAPTN